MSFTPKSKESNKGVSRKDRIVCLDIGVDRKKRLTEYAKKHNLSISETVRQIVDYCILD